MDTRQKLDISYTFGTLLFSIPSTTLMSFLMIIAAGMFKGSLLIQISIVSFIFSSYQILIEMIQAIKKRKFLHPHLFIVAAVLGTFCLGLWREGACGMAVYSACSNILKTSVTDLQYSYEYCPHINGFNELYYKIVNSMSAKPSSTETGIKKACALYTVFCLLVVCFLSVSVPFLWRLDYTVWLRRAFILLASACPGAMLLSASLEFSKCISLSAMHGILYKSRNAILKASRITSMAFFETAEPKSGYHIAQMIPAGISNDKLLILAAYACAESDSGYAEVIKQESGTKIDESLISHYIEISGKGNAAEVNHIRIAAGTAELMDDLHVGYPSVDSRAPILYIACEGKYAGCIIFSEGYNVLKDDFIVKLHHNNIDRIILLSENKHETVKNGNESEFDEVYPELNADKALQKMNDLQKMQITGENLAFIDDGFSHPQLRNAADVTISIGTDYAASSSDIVIPQKDTSKVADAVSLCKNTLKNTRINIIVCSIIKVLILIAAVLGLGGIWLSIVLDTIAGLIVIAGISLMHLSDSFAMDS